VAADSPFCWCCRLLALGCYEHVGTGGENGLLDGLAVAERLRTEDPAAFKFLAETPIPSEFREERGDAQRHHFVSNDRVFKLDPLTGDVVQVR
jgi:gamma-butyrobetaine dioxygenase